MYTLILLIKTKFFKDSIKENPPDLIKYIIDYAEYSSILLEQLGYYRYCQLNSCILGLVDPKKFTQLLSESKDFQTFYCNGRKTPIPEDEKERAYAQPEEYAIVIYNCHE